MQPIKIWMSKFKVKRQPHKMNNLIATLTNNNDDYGNSTKTTTQKLQQQQEGDSTQKLQQQRQQRQQQQQQRHSSILTQIKLVDFSYVMEHGRKNSATKHNHFAMLPCAPEEVRRVLLPQNKENKEGGRIGEGDRIGEDKVTLTNYHSSCPTSSEWICKRLSLCSGVCIGACVREGRLQALAVKTCQSLLLLLIVCDTHSYNHLLFLSPTPYDYPSLELLISTYFVHSASL